MNLPDPQVIANAWMSQMSDPGQWQSWFNAAPAALGRHDAGCRRPHQAG
jgi:polyhydroxyalkanoate synthase